MVDVLVQSMFCAVGVLMQSIFEVPLEMSLAGMVDVSTPSKRKFHHRKG